MTTSPRLVYTPSPGRVPAVPAGSEVTFHESHRCELDGIKYGFTPQVACAPLRVLCDTPRGAQQLRVADLSVSA